MIKHCFFDKNCKIDRELADHGDLKMHLQEKDWQCDAINFVNQIHSDEVVVIDDFSKINAVQGLPKADAIVTNQEKLAIAIVTADCAPVVLKDQKSGVLAVVHAGWRGAKNGIIQNSVKAMIELGSDIESIEAFIGPMIHQNSYQVSQEFYDDFLADDSNHDRFFKEDIEEGRHLFDLVAFVEAILKSCDVSKIESSEIDTYKDCNYSSYRRSCHESADLSGRNVSIALL